MSGPVRKEIIPGVMLTVVQSDRFKTDCLSITLLTQLCPENASKNALIPYVLRRGTGKSPDMKAVTMRLEDLYGTEIVPVVRRVGEIQCTGLYASFPDSRYLPEGEDILPSVTDFMGEMLLRPKTRGGLFLPDVVESEKEKMKNIIRSRINDKSGYALTRCMEEMCCFEDYSTMRFGTEETVDVIRYKDLTQHYHRILAESPVEIFYCGACDPDRMELLMLQALSTLPRQELDLDLGTDVRLNSVEADPRSVEETLDLQQGKLVLGFRLGDCMEDPSAEELAAIRVFNECYGGSVTSRLFKNVREKLSLCYYASSMLEVHKGLMFVSSGIRPENRDVAQAEILQQLDSLREGTLTDEELTAAKNSLSSAYRSLRDSQGALESYYVNNALDGLLLTPEEMAGLVDEITAEDVQRIARSVVLDLVYFLHGGAPEEEDDETEEEGEVIDE